MGKKIKISATRISTFLKCKRRYWYQYVDKIPKLSNPSFRLGLACHEALELAGNIWLEGGDGKTEFTEDEVKRIMDEYIKVSVREGIEEMEVHDEGMNLVLSRLCSFNIGKSLLSLELPFGFPGHEHADLTTSEGVPLIGKIDKIVELDSESILIVDYKTSKTVPTPGQLKTDLQLSLYDLVGSILWPDCKRIVLCLDMLKHDPVYTYRTKEQRENFNKYLTEVYNQMTSLKNEKDATPSLNILCPWCDFKDYCSEYKEACDKSKHDFMPISKMSDSELVSEYERLTKTMKILDMRKREMGMLMMEKIQRDGGSIKGDDSQIVIRQNSRTSYDPRAIVNAIPAEDLSGVVSINKKAIEGYGDKNPAWANIIKESSITNYTTPFLVTKKLNK